MSENEPSSGGRYLGYFDLGFRAPSRPPTGTDEPLWLGPKAPVWVKWEVGAWISVAAGIFARSVITFEPLGFDLNRVRWGALLASVIIALALLPVTMRWLNRFKTQVGAMHVAMPFALGFFLDLAVVEAIQIPERILNLFG